MNHAKLSLVLLLSLSSASILAMQQISKDQLDANKAVMEKLKEHLAPKAGAALEEYSAPQTAATVQGQPVETNQLCLTNTLDVKTAYRLQQMQAASLEAQESLLKKQKEEKLKEAKATLIELQRRTAGKEASSTGNNMQIESIDKQIKQLQIDRQALVETGKILVAEFNDLRALVNLTQEEIVKAEKEKKEKEQQNSGWGWFNRKKNQ